MSIGANSEFQKGACLLVCTCTRDNMVLHRETVLLFVVEVTEFYTYIGTTLRQFDQDGCWVYYFCNYIIAILHLPNVHKYWYNV